MSLEWDTTPDLYAALWSDNFFWLVPGETRTITGKVRLDMKGLDPVIGAPVITQDNLAFSISAWNAAAVMLKAK